MIILHLSGGLGNQMFQYAFGYATAKRIGTKLVLDLSDPTLQIHNGYELERVFGIKTNIATSANLKDVLGLLCNRNVRRLVKKLGISHLFSNKYVIETQFRFIPEMLEVQDNIYLSGYWQSAKYFQVFSQEIHREFSFIPLKDQNNQSLLSDIDSHKETAISLHVRRADYVNNLTNSRLYATCTQDYYQSAINYLTERVSYSRFYVFSDDIDWVKDNLVLNKETVFVVNNKGDQSYNDMHLMSLCKHNIIANSSFSWWGAWLNVNPEKIVIAPKQWFADGRDDSDLIPATWIRV